METGDATELQAHIRKVCDNAFKLAMVMRRSRDGYKCETPPVEKGACLLAEFDTLVEPMSVEGGKNTENSGHIAYTLFGALTKHPASQADGPRVLEKAQVVMKCR